MVERIPNSETKLIQELGTNPPSQLSFHVNVDKINE